MVKLLNSIKNDIDITAGLNDNQIYALNQILHKYSNAEYNENDDKGFSSSIIVDKIEQVVNQLYHNGKIKNIDIKQRTEVEYEFNNILITLRVEQDTLVVEGHEITLEDWLLYNFPTEENQNTQSLNSHNMQPKKQQPRHNSMTSYNKKKIK